MTGLRMLMFLVNSLKKPWMPMLPAHDRPIDLKLNMQTHLAIPANDCIIVTH